MLVLQRNIQESVVIVLPDGRHVKITLLKIPTTYSARLGFEADPDVKILRTELLMREPNNDGK